MSGQFGVHSLVFTDDWNPASARSACMAAREIGYDLIEVLIFDPARLDVRATADAVKEAGIGLRLGMALGPDTDIASDDPEIAARGEATVARCLEIASQLEAPALSGIVYAAFHSYGAPQTPAQWARVAEKLGRLDRRAGELGLRLGLEAVNRYESFMINTLDQAAAMIRDAGAANMFIHMDTFHMNIEEGDVTAAIHRNAGLLGYAHVADSNRGVLGGGHFDLVGYFRALESVGYTGDITVESFSSKVLGPDLVGGVRLWRPAFDNAVEAARTALQLMQAARAAAIAGTRVW
ncbi:sugar phosphate isomerase/epimerase family protein [Ensifer soli]|uniref:sugar phosphate isomerase/epimerase family protein n=1 Tax=Ciceribacter sp. sgz301302 TaxID=3342379 RepID=UPI0035BA2913